MSVEKLLLISNLILYAVYVYMYIRVRRLTIDLHISRLATRVAISMAVDKEKSNAGLSNDDTNRTFLL